MLAWFVGGGGGEHRSNIREILSVGAVISGFMQSILWLTMTTNNLHLSVLSFQHFSGPGGSPSPSTAKDSKLLKLEPKDSPKSSTSQGIQSPKEALQAITELEGSKLPDESTGGLSSLPCSPGSSTPITENAELKMAVYSPSQEQFTMPEIANEAQTSTSMPTPAVSDVQGAKQYISDSEYSVSSNSDQPGNYFSPLTSRGYSFSQSSISPSPLMSPSTYPATFNTQPFHAGSAEAMMTTGSTMYPSAACMSPSAYMSPYATGKQYTWPTTPSGMTYPGTFGMNSHEIGYTAAATYQPHYSQMTRMTGYPAGYTFPSQLPPTSSPTC